MSSGATERRISVTWFSTTEFRSEVAGRRTLEIFEIMHKGPSNCEINVNLESPIATDVRSVRLLLSGPRTIICTGYVNRPNLDHFQCRRKASLLMDSATEKSREHSSCR